MNAIIYIIATIICIANNVTLPSIVSMSFNIMFISSPQLLTASRFEYC